MSSGASGLEPVMCTVPSLSGPEHVPDALEPRLAFEPDRLAGHLRLRGPRRHQDLGVDALEVGPGLQEPDDVVRRRRERAAVRRQVLEPLIELRDRAAQLAVVADVLAQSELQQEAVMLAHVRADVRLVDAHVDARGEQHLRRSDAGQLEEPRRLDAAEGENHFAVRSVLGRTGGGIRAHADDLVALEHE